MGENVLAGVGAVEAVAEQGDRIEIPRRLIHKDSKTGQISILEEIALDRIVGPIIILGDPGLGKSVLTQKLGRQGRNCYVRAGTFARSKSQQTFLPGEGGKLVVDGLDEIASNTPGGGIEAILAQLSALGHPEFILSSREADWNGAAARVQIEDDYGQTVTVLHLAPFNEADAVAFLNGVFPKLDAPAVLNQLRTSGLQEMYGNPLTLRLVGEVAQSESVLPRTRAELLDKACQLMLAEDNPRHQSASHARRTAEEMVLAAGAICASLLLCDRFGIFSGPASVTPDDCFALAAIESLPLASAAADVLKTRLVQSDGISRFIPAHRVIAEYLGARWLATCFERGASERRVRALITQADGVPTSLRGLNAWIAHFSDTLAPACIRVDPFAVLRYGNAETLPLRHARVLLSALSMLSTEDPYFRSEDWGRHPAAGLMRAELLPELVGILSDPEARPSLIDLLLEAMAEAPLAATLAAELTRILLQTDRRMSVRSRALDALVESGAIGPIEPLVRELIAAGDGSSPRLAFNLLSAVGFQSVPPLLAAEVVLSFAGVGRALDRRERDTVIHIPKQVFEIAESSWLADFLDAFSDGARTYIEKTEHWSAKAVTTAAREATLAVIAKGIAPSGERVWRWLGWLQQQSSYGDEGQAELDKIFAADVALRRAIQVQTLLAAPANRTSAVAYNLRAVSPALMPDADDILALFDTLSAQASPCVEIERITALAGLCWNRGNSDAVRQAALSLSAGDKSLKKIFQEWSKPRVDAYAKRNDERQRREHAKRQKVYASVRKKHQEHTEDIRAGDFKWLSQTANVYLGRFPEFDKKIEPEARVECFLGQKLAEDALDGFMASLLRSDLPTAAQIAQAHADSKRYHVEPVLISGAAEMVRRGASLATVPRANLESAYMAWRDSPESNTVGKINIDQQLEELLFNSDTEIETYFRMSIEPRLLVGARHLVDLYYLTHDKRFTTVAGKLCADWLVRFDELSIHDVGEMLDTVIREGTSDARHKLVVCAKSRVHSSYEVFIEWLAAEFALDFVASHDALRAVAADDRHLLWRIRSRVGNRREVIVPLSLQQRTFVVEAFSAVWPQTEHPGSSMGDTNPWDASEFIERMIYSIAGDPAPEATECLIRLIDDASPTYENTLRHALARQRRARRDQEYAPSTLEQVESVTRNALPETIDDMRAYFGDRLATVQARMHATNTDMWEAYWNGACPRGENFCRNRLVEQISGQLPEAVRFEPEMHMPSQKRADIAAIRGAIGLPVEIKGQWHPEVWNAPVKQLAALYTRDWHAENRGVYIVLWFGRTAGKNLPRHPEGLPTPTTSAELLRMLQDRVPEPQRDLIDVYVVDVSRVP